MIIGTVREIKNHEYRVGLRPESVQKLTRRGHQLLVERDAGAGIEAAVRDYAQVGAIIVTTAAEVFSRTELVVKVKEPQTAERQLLREGSVLFTYLHLAPDPEQAAEQAIG